MLTFNRKINLISSPLSKQLHMIARSTACVTSSSSSSSNSCCIHVQVPPAVVLPPSMIASSSISSIHTGTLFTYSSKHTSRSQLPSQFIQKRNMFIQTSNTPNPESIKFIPGRPVLSSSNNNNNNNNNNDDSHNHEITNGFYVTVSEKSEITKSPLCTQLFKDVDGIKAIYLGNDFITITKYAEHNWTHLRPLIFSSIMNFYTNQPDPYNPTVLSSQPIISDTTILDTDDEVVAMIKELLETRIRPAVQDDGGDIHYVNYDVDSGIVYVKLAGSCVGCPSSSVTLKNGVENMLMHYIPEVSGVEAIMEEEEEEEGKGGDGSNDGDHGGDDIEKKKREQDMKKAKTYEERLRAAGIPYSD
jgi:Fe-S cluster biogenesis protein NfuA